jgi:hypothetical protein
MPTDEATTILKRDVLGRVTLSTEQREALLDEFERSGLKGLPFARLVGVNYQSFASWIQKRRRERGDYAKMTAAKSTGPCPSPAAAVVTRRPLRLLEAVAAPTSTTSGSALQAEASALEVVLPGGAKLLLKDASQVALAAELLNALRTPC